MINLIPNEEKKNIAANFYFRVATLSFVMLGISLIVASVAILPSYFFSSTEEVLVNEKLKLQENEVIPTPDQDALIIVKDLKNKLNLIENAQKNESNFSQKVINEIVLKKTSNIKITKISYQNDAQTGKKISISGIAPSREALLSFRRALEDDIAFSKVNLPISNFVKGSNIKFYLSLIPS